MKLRELKNPYPVMSEFKRQLRDWKKTTWWHKLETETHHQMLNWFKGFIKFRRRVLDGEDIETSLLQWIGIDVEFSNCIAIKNKTNVPQLSMFDAYTKAKTITEEINNALARNNSA